MDCCTAKVKRTMDKVSDDQNTMKAKCKNMIACINVPVHPNATMAIAARVTA